MDLAREPGTYFYATFNEGESVNGDLMQPYLGLFKVPTPVSYPQRFEQAELLVVVKGTDHEIQLPPESGGRGKGK